MDVVYVFLFFFLDPTQGNVKENWIRIWFGFECVWLWYHRRRDGNGGHCLLLEYQPPLDWPLEEWRHLPSPPIKTLLAASAVSLRFLYWHKEAITGSWVTTGRSVAEYGEFLRLLTLPSPPPPLAHAACRCSTWTRVSLRALLDARWVNRGFLCLLGGEQGFRLVFSFFIFGGGQGFRFLWNEQGFCLLSMDWTGV